MTQQEIDELVNHGERVYQERYRDVLEKSHHGRFCTIEPTSGQYFLGETMREAAHAARETLPGCKFYTLRIGHPLAIHLTGFTFLSKESPEADPTVIVPAR